MKNCEKTFLKNIQEIVEKVKNIRRFDVLGRHYQVKKIQYECSINTRKTIVH